MIASVLQIVGLVLIVAALALWIPIIGLAALGGAIFAIGWQLEGQ